MTQSQVLLPPSKQPPQDRVYKLVTGRPLSYELAAKDTVSYRLLYYDPEKRQSRVLRYAANHNSPFVDEQSGEAVMQSINLSDGMLSVPKENPALQEFLFYTPDRGKVFVEVDYAKDAEAEMEKMDKEADAIIAANKLSVEHAEHIYRVLFGKDPSLVKTAIMMRDIKVYCRTHAVDFLSKLDDPALTMQSDVRLLFDRGVLQLKFGGRSVCYNLRDNKKQMVSVPMGEDPYRVVQSYFETDEGIEAKKILDQAIDDM